MRVEKLEETLEAQFDHRVSSIKATLVGRNSTELAAQIRALWNLPEDTLAVLAHAFETFGSVEHTVRWLMGTCASIPLGGSTPLNCLQYGSKQCVGDALTHIDQGM